MASSEKKIIIITLALFLSSGVFLSLMEIRQQDPNTGKNWWSVSFDDPKSSSLNFTIANHSDGNSFHWTAVTAGGTKLKEGNEKITKGGTSEIKIENQTLNATGKILIDVSSGNDKEEIYKNLN